MVEQDCVALVASATGSLSGDETGNGASALARSPLTPDQALREAYNAWKAATGSDEDALARVLELKAAASCAVAETAGEAGTLPLPSPAMHAINGGASR